MSRMAVPMARPRSNAEIEQRTLRFIERFYPQCLSEPQPVPVDHFLEFLIPRHTGTLFGVAPLKHPLEAVTVPADRNGPTQVILSERVYDRMCAGDGRARFTGAHEGGHVVLHDQELHTALVNGTFQGLYRKSEIVAYRDPEHQANVFASRFLLPKPAVLLAIQQFGPNVERLAEIFLVSRTAMRIRLGDFGYR